MQSNDDFPVLTASISATQKAHQVEATKPLKMHDTDLV
ncbi:hypothetical protein VOA_002348 [Vibrio sp. RC586]|nr:hypothetical protein VOA_002348 [Vibrio sp. RC586]